MKIKNLDEGTKLEGINTEFGKIVKCTLNAFSDVVNVRVEDKGIVYAMITRYQNFLDWNIVTNKGGSNAEQD